MRIGGHAPLELPKTVKLDWRAYWEKFKEIHGQPFPFEGRLLFADGWRYSASDLKGPEWPPPEEPKELRRLQLAYWTMRLSLARAQRDALRAELKQLEAAQRDRPVPLQASSVVFDEEQRKNVRTTQDLDVAAIRAGRLTWLEEDAASAAKEVERLTAEGTEDGLQAA